MEEALFDIPMYCEFAQFDDHGRTLGENTVLRFRHRQEKYKLAKQVLVTVNDLVVDKELLLEMGPAMNASLIAAPISMKKIDKAHDFEMQHSKKGQPAVLLDESVHWRECRLGFGTHRQRHNPGMCSALDKTGPADALLSDGIKLKASVMANVEYPFRVLKS